MSEQFATDVLIVGAGPVGLTLAAELARHGIRSRIVDRLKQPSPNCRAIGVTPRTLEVWDDMGIAREMIDAGIWIDSVRTIVNGQTTDLKVDLSDLPFAMLGLPQNDTERILTRQLSDYNIPVERGVSLESLAQSEVRVETVLTNGADRENASFRYIVGCDGAHSTVRRALGIAFEGSAIPAEFALGDVHIDWSIPRGVMLRLVQPRQEGTSDVFIAVPLPEMGRYRVSINAPPDLAAAPGSMAPGATGHGIQSERPAPGIEHLQAVADKLLPEKAVLSDLHWSSIFRISMRLTAKYRQGNVFIAGDAAHIHPPTGGQGMNTGIQDAYNLAWKLALVLKGTGNESLLDSYEAERRPVGVEVVARTSRSIQSERRASDDRYADTQVLISYRGSPWIEPAEAHGNEGIGPLAGDRAADAQGLRRTGVGFDFRLFDILRCIEHVLIAYCNGPDSDAQLADLAEFCKEIGRGGGLRAVAIVPPGATPPQPPTISLYQDSRGLFGQTYGLKRTVILIRPDGHLAWRGESCRDATLRRQLDRVFARRVAGYTV